MLKKIFFIISCTSIIHAIPESTAKNEFTQRQLSALKVFRSFDAFAGGIVMAGGVVSILPKNTPFVVKAAAFVPISLILSAIGYQAWEYQGMDEHFKKHKWLLLGL